jgi:hypothetical protein
MTDALSANIGGQADMQRMFGYVRNSEFYRWVDSIISPREG